MENKRSRGRFLLRPHRLCEIVDLMAGPTSPAGGPRAGYDAVIVGGGHNGLVACAYLARAGRSCLLLERRAQLGGAAVSERIFPHLDARISAYSYLVSLLPETIVRELALPIRLARRSVSSYTPDPRVGSRRGLLVDSGQLAASAASFHALGATEHAAWESFYSMTSRIARAVFPTMTEPLRSRAQLRKLINDAEAWETLFERPLGETLSERFDDDLVAGVVATDALIGTFADLEDPSLLQNRCLLYHVIGRGSGEWKVPIGGMGALTDALADAASTAGAELKVRSEVLSVQPEEDGAEVTFLDGECELRVHARHVLVNAAPTELQRLLDEDDTGSPEGAQLKVNLLLSRLPRLRDQKVDPVRAFTGTFHVNESLGQLQDAYRQAGAGEIPRVVPCEAYCHSLTDPSILDEQLQADGAQTMTVFALHMPARLFRADPSIARERALRGTIESLDSVLAEPIEDCVMRDVDGRACIEVRSPLDIEQELRMPGGHIFHRDLSWPFAQADEEVGKWGVESEHSSILLCGAGARRGGGVSGIPGRNAAMAILAG
jgi:phytoene dehydrogenase-like protein